LGLAVVVKTFAAFSWIGFFMARNKVGLVVGASGVIGSAVYDVISKADDWTAKGVRRSASADTNFIACDLSDASSTAAAMKKASDTTHVFYAAFNAGPFSGAQDENEANVGMLQNVLDGLRLAGAVVERVVLFQGAKVYGAHLGKPPVTPFYEDASRYVGPNFYFGQEDLLRKRAAAGGGSWVALRPDAVIGDVMGNVMNIAAVLGVFAALSKDGGVPLKFPGSLHTYRNVFGQLTDAGWLGRASLWAALDPRAENEAFNMVNEPFRWERLWQKVGARLGMAVEDPQPLTMSRQLADQGAAWARIAKQHGLKDTPLEKLVNWGFGDFVWSIPFDMVSDMGKARRAGFVESVDVEESVLQALTSMAEHKHIPRFEIRPRV
jgi:nucleoside-diphosphate-sugar epimerase